MVTAKQLLSISSVVCLVTGVACVWAQKWQARAIQRRCGDPFDSYCDRNHFQAPLWQTMVMFIAEGACLSTYLVNRFILEKTRRQPKVFALLQPDMPCLCMSTKPKYAYLTWAIPAVLDLIGATLSNIAFTMTYASTVQMMRSLCVIATAVLSLFIIRKPLRIHQWLGITGITLGMALAGLGAVFNPEEESNFDPAYAWVGVVLALIGTSLQSLQLVVEEALFRRWAFHPLQAMGLEGVCGMMMCSLALLVAHLTSFEDSRITVYQMMISSQIFWASIIYMVVCFFFNGSGIVLTQLGGSVLKSTIFALRASVLWILELIIGWHTFDWYNLASLILSVLSFALYSKIPMTWSKLRQPVVCCCTLDMEDFEDESPAAASSGSRPCKCIEAPETEIWGSPSAPAGTDDCQCDTEAILAPRRTQTPPPPLKLECSRTPPPRPVTPPSASERVPCRVCVAEERREL